MGRYFNCKNMKKNKKINKISGAEIFFKSLLKNNCEIIFGYPGGAIMPVYDALTKYENKIKHILTGHEQGAVHMAEGYARAGQKVGVCLATSGPGATNFVTGIADAMMDSVPIVCFTGQVSTKLIGTEAFQETPIVDIVKPITKWAYQIKKVSEIEKVIDRAFYLAKNGRPGPVLIDFPKDIQLGLGYFRNAKIRKVEKEAVFKNSAIKNFTNLVNASPRTLVLVGHGIKIADAKEELSFFLEKTNLPVTTTLHGRDCVDSSYLENYGMLGMHGNILANKAVNKADLIIALGMRFDDRVTGDLKKFAVNTKIIHVDIDKKQIGKKVKTELGIESDVKKFLQKVVGKVDFTTVKENSKNWQSFKCEYKNLEYQKIYKKEIVEPVGEINMGEVVEAINKVKIQNKIVVPDVGQHQMSVARYVNFSNGTKFFSSGGLGTMGFSLPAAIGAYFANKKSLTISISGDGGFQMNIQELATVMRNKIPLKIFILNNSYLGMVRQWQEMFYAGNESVVSLDNPDFQKIAEAYGIMSIKINT